MKKLVVLLFISITGLSHADNGIYTISQTCQTFGCFPGDFSGFPITITSPGSYMLTSDIVSTETTNNVIRITSSNVTIDLNGFAIIGPRTCTGYEVTLSCTNSGMTSDGISASGTVDGIRIKNGTIKGFDTGIAIDKAGIIENVIVEQNEEGIFMPRGVVRNSQANRNILKGFTSIISGSVPTGTLIIRNSSAVGNFSFGAFARVCSNVFFKDNLAGASGDDKCIFYTNDSYCAEFDCVNN